MCLNRGSVSDPNLKVDEVQMKENLSFEAQLVSIKDEQVKQL